jgi:hypothetical protein
MFNPPKNHETGYAIPKLRAMNFFPPKSIRRQLPQSPNSTGLSTSDPFIKSGDCSDCFPVSQLLNALTAGEAVGYISLPIHEKLNNEDIILSKKQRMSGAS